MHMVDPKAHATRKGIKKAARKSEVKTNALSSARQAPATHKGSVKEVPASRRNAKRKAEDEIVRHIAFVASTAPPDERILERFRRRMQQKHIEQKDDTRQGEQVRSKMSNARSNQQGEELKELANDSSKTNLNEVTANKNR